MKAVLITAIICVTLVMITWLNKKGRDNERRDKE